MLYSLTLLIHGPFPFRCTPKIGQKIPEPSASQLQATIMSEAGAKAKAKAEAAKAKAAEQAAEAKELAEAGYEEERKEAEAEQAEAEREQKEAEQEEKDKEKEVEEKKKKDEEAEEKMNRCLENRRKKKECEDKKKEEEERKPFEEDMETVMETMILSEGEGEKKWYIDDCYDCATNLTVTIHKDCCAAADWSTTPEECHKSACEVVDIACCKDTAPDKNPTDEEKEACAKEVSGKCINPKSFQEKKQAEMGCEQQLKAKLYKMEEDRTVHWRKNENETEIQ